MKFTKEECRIAVAYLMDCNIHEEATFANLETLAKKSSAEKDDRILYAITAGLGKTAQCLYVDFLNNKFNRKLEI